MKNLPVFAAFALSLITLLGCSPSEQAPVPVPAPAAAAAANAPQAAAHPASGKVYVCEMGCEVVETPGKCSKCGMDLKEVDRSQVAYVCGACGYKSDKPGVCPKDSVVLNFKLAEKTP